MRTLVRWDPFAGFFPFALSPSKGRRAMDRPLFDFYGPSIWRRDSLTFPVDVSETDEQVVVKAALPGIQPEEVDISVTDGVLTIKGETKSDESTDGKNYHRREIRYGAFYRSVPLPAQVNDEKAEAAFKDGVLSVTLPKAEEAKPKQIKIKAS